MSTELVRYDAMCRAIADAHEVDEVKDIRDKAVALEVYARQAKNVEAEQQATEIRLRAERRVGQLLREIEKAKGARGNASNQYQREVPSDHPRAPKTLADLGISYDQSSQWQKLAAVPEPDFELALQRDRPTTNGIISAHAPAKHDVVDATALWLWGRLRDFERDRLFDLDPNELLETMLPHMVQTTKQLAPLVAAWLGRIK